jgi:hypothetical protein
VKNAGKFGRLGRFREKKKSEQFRIAWDVFVKKPVESLQATDIFVKKIGNISEG